MRRRADEGAIAVIAAMFAIVMFMLAALVVDLGHARSDKKQSANAADAASLAAAEILAEGGDITTATAAAKTSALSNAGISSAAWSGCTDVNALPVAGEAGNGCITFDSASPPKTVEVRIPDRLVKTEIGGAVGVSRVAVTGTARATIDQLAPCLVCILGDYSTNNSDLSVTGGSISIGGQVTTGPNGDISALSSSSLVQFVDTSPNIKGNVTPGITTVDHVYDPLAAMTLPPAGAQALGSAALVSSGACQAGKTYRNLNGCTSFTSGVYVVTEDTSFGASGIVSPDMLIYMACETVTGSNRFSRACTSAAADGTDISAGGNAQFRLNGLDIPGYGRFAVIYDRNNKGTYSDQGTADSVLQGGFYGKSASVHNGGNATLTLSGLIVAASVSGNGNKAGVTDVYTGSAYHTSALPYLIR